MPQAIGSDWGEFCNKLEDYPTKMSFPYDLGHEGLGVCVSTGFGDGSYPVYARIVDEGDWGRRISAIFVDFFGDAFEEDEDEDEEEKDMPIAFV